MTISTSDGRDLEMRTEAWTATSSQRYPGWRSLSVMYVFKTIPYLATKTANDMMVGSTEKEAAHHRECNKDETYLAPTETQT